MTLLEKIVRFAFGFKGGTFTPLGKSNNDFTKFGNRGMPFLVKQVETPPPAATARDKQRPGSWQLGQRLGNSYKKAKR